MNKAKRSRTQCFMLLLGMARMIFYFLHVIIGRQFYPGYNPLTQAVSDLTAASAPSQEAAAIFTQISGMCAVSLCMLLCIFFKGQFNKPFRLGIYLFTGMEWLSGVGYMAFPLSDRGYAGTFQDIMHIVITALVVLLSVAAMILIAAGCFRHKTPRTFGFITLIALGLMFIGSIGTGIFPAYLGIAERFSVYSVILYSAVLSVFAFCRPAVRSNPN